MKPLRVVVLTNRGSVFGKDVVDALKGRGVEIAGIVVIAQPLSYYWKLFRWVHRRVGLVDAVFFSLQRVRHGDTLPSAAYDDFGPPVFHVQGTNTPETVDAVRSLAPDLMILAQTGIVRKALLGVPTIGTLNAHPGLLPSYRGIDCARWAILNGDWEQIGASVHWVDAGVDTGRVIAKEPVSVPVGSTIEEIDRLLDGHSAALLARVVAEMREGNVPEGSAQGEGVQYYKMSRKDEARVRRALAQRVPATRATVVDAPPQP
jgi:folate-dependent phosphoribosylglycinamide formyltransferase PurN